MYDEERRIKAINNYSINGGPHLPLSFIDEFEYNNEGEIIKQVTKYSTSGEIWRIKKYYWEEGNVQRMEEYTGSEELEFEYFYIYDDQKNYKKGLPMYLTDFESWNKNNVKEMDFNDYAGYLDLACKPCTVKYNLDGYPVKIEFNWDRSLNLKYE